MTWVVKVWKKINYWLGGVPRLDSVARNDVAYGKSC